MTPEDAQAQQLVEAMTDDERLWCLDGDGPFWAGVTHMGQGGYHRAPFPAGRIDRLGIPGFVFADGPRGVVVDRATCFPVTMARGATWDVDLEERIGEAIGRELRVVGADLFGGVCVNLLRHPAWGRAQETYGEDPHHVGEMGAARTRGVQRHAMACVKHFAGNSMEEARFRVDVEVDEVARHEVYLPHFRRIVDEGVASVMSAYNAVNGEWCGESRALLTDVLRDEWGFEGVVISDFIYGLRDPTLSLTAGLDVEMPFRMIRAHGLPDALIDGTASWADVDRAARRVVATRLRFADVLAAPAPARSVLASPEHRALAREAARRSVVLLRNEPAEGAPVLPLDAGSLSAVGVFGALAALVNLGDGGSSDVWAPDATTVLDGMRAVLPAAAVAHLDGSDLEAASALAARVDVAVVVVGTTADDEGEFIGEMDGLDHLLPPPDDPVLAEDFAARVAPGESIQPPDHVRARDASAGFARGGDRRSLALSDEQVALVRAVADAAPRTIVALVGGSAVVTAEWEDQVPAVVQAWYGGMEAGGGLADVLFGVVDASGRLPFTVPARARDLVEFDPGADAVTYDDQHGWWRADALGLAPAHPFGFGLSYTSFAVEEVAAQGAPEGAPVVGPILGLGAGTAGAGAVRAAVRNTGDRDGSHVVQVYASRDGWQRQRLVGFARIDVRAGGSATVRVEVSRAALADRDTERHQMVVRPGRYELRVAAHAADPGTRVALTLSPT